MGESVDVRIALESETDRLGTIWYEAWQDGHAGLLPAELIETRTLESFRSRMRDNLPSTRVAGPPGAPLGFCTIREDELYQLFVAREGRGSGVAAALLSDGETRLAANGVEVAWLSCAIGNQRAARFYEKCGWQRTENIILPLETLRGTLELETWRYEKRVK